MDIDLRPIVEQVIREYQAKLARRTRLEKRREVILQLRAKGLTYQAIGERLGITRQRVQFIVKRESERGVR